jgi:hypothetical protein
MQTLGSNKKPLIDYAIRTINTWLKDNRKTLQAAFSVAKDQKAKFERYAPLRNAYSALTELKAALSDSCLSGAPPASDIKNAEDPFTGHINLITACITALFLVKPVDKIFFQKLEKITKIFCWHIFNLPTDIEECRTAFLEDKKHLFHIFYKTLINYQTEKYRKEAISLHNWMRVAFITSFSRANAGNQQMSTPEKPIATLADMVTAFAGNTLKY